MLGAVVLAGVLSTFSDMDEFSDDMTDRDDVEEREELKDMLLVDVAVAPFLLCFDLDPSLDPSLDGVPLVLVDESCDS